MKKIYSFLLVALVALLIFPMNSEARPIWIKFKLGIFAKWGITLGGGCEPSWGICIAFGDNTEPNFFGYDKETDKFSIKVPKSAPEAKHFSQAVYELKEDSPVDPKLLAKVPDFNSGGKLLIMKGGKYPVTDTGDAYVITFAYILK